MLSVTYYTQNYARIIGGPLVGAKVVEYGLTVCFLVARMILRYWALQESNDDDNSLFP